MKVTAGPIENLRLVAKYKYQKDFDKMTARDWMLLRDYIGETLVAKWGVAEYINDRTSLIPRITLQAVTYSFSTPDSQVLIGGEATITFEAKI